MLRKSLFLKKQTRFRLKLTSFHVSPFCWMTMQSISGWAKCCSRSNWLAGLTDWLIGIVVFWYADDDDDEFLPPPTKAYISNVCPCLCSIKFLLWITESSIIIINNDFINTDFDLSYTLCSAQMWISGFCFPLNVPKPRGLFIFDVIHQKKNLWWNAKDFSV